MSVNYPRHLGGAFADVDVVRNYRYRQPYPPEVFAVLETLLVAPFNVLDVGCGTGELTYGLARFATRVDAVDPSEAMIREAQRAGADERIHWIVGRAEDVSLAPPYGLITAGASIHWMDPEIVMPRFKAALAPGAKLAIVDSESIYPEGEPWRVEFIGVIRRYSPIHHDDLAALLKEFEASGRFVREGERATVPVTYEQSIDDYMAMLASTSSLSHVTLGARFDDFVREARAVFARHSLTAVRAQLVAGVVWGRPR